jgi:hypothetical protein
MMPADATQMFHQVGDLLLVRDVALRPGALAARGDDLVRDAGEVLLVHVADDDLDAFGGHRLRHRLTDAARAAGDDRYTAFEFHVRDLFELNTLRDAPSPFSV